jgi:hypothetical protein
LEIKFPPTLGGSNNNTLVAPLTIRDIYNYVKSLKNSVETWYQLLNPQDSGFTDDEKFWLERINRLEEVLRATPLSTVLIMVFYQKEKSISQRVRLLKAVERYLFILTFPLRLSFAYDGRFLDWTGAADQIMAGEQPDKVVKDIEQWIDEEYGKASSMEQIVNDFRATGFYNWRGCRYFLYEYELELTRKAKRYGSAIDWNTLITEDRRDYHTVEHVYPQQPRKGCWTSKFQKYTDKERTSLRHSLGNLTALSQPKNSTFQNECFEEKKAGKNGSTVSYRNGSLSEREIASQADWTAQEILQRGLKMVSFMETRWKLKFGERSSKIRLLNLEFVEKKDEH